MKYIQFDESHLATPYGQKLGSRSFSTNLPLDTRNAISEATDGDRSRSAWLGRAAELLLGLQEIDGEETGHLAAWAAWLTSADEEIVAHITKRLTLASYLIGVEVKRKEREEEG